MALVNITNIVVENNPGPFTSPVTMTITFECMKNLEEEIEWKLIYIGSPKDEQHDQVLDQFMMGPLEKGVMQFTLESQAPDFKKIPTKNDLLGITAIILTVSFKSKEFFRVRQVGYYVYNNYKSEENIENEPEEVIINDIQRSILSDKPRITRFSVPWGDDQQGQVEEESQQNNYDFMFANPEEEVMKDAQKIEKQDFQMNDVFNT